MLKKSFYVITLWGSVIFFFLANQRGCRASCFESYVSLYFIFLILLFISYHILKAKPDVWPEGTNTAPPKDPFQSTTANIIYTIIWIGIIWGAIKLFGYFFN